MRGIDPRQLASACLDGGARLLQVRQKGPGTGTFVSIVRDIVTLGTPRDSYVLANDRSDVAALAGAGGVHVGQDDLPVSDVRRILGPERMIGLSTHTREQVDEALATSATYVAVGPVFRTSTKDTGYEPRGLDLVRYAAGRGKPVVAIGGITLTTAPEALAAGASAVAIISDLLVDADPRARVRAYVERLR